MLKSTYIPLGHTHRLENSGKIDLRLIEVLSGAYLGEDYIVRYDDTYGHLRTSIYGLALLKTRNCSPFT